VFRERLHPIHSRDAGTSSIWLRCAETVRFHRHQARRADPHAAHLEPEQQRALPQSSNTTARHPSSLQATTQGGSVSCRPHTVKRPCWRRGQTDHTRSGLRLGLAANQPSASPFPPARSPASQGPPWRPLHLALRSPMKRTARLSRWLRHRAWALP
jgi:hypothetical protein